MKTRAIFPFKTFTLLAFVSLGVAGCSVAAEVIWLDALDLRPMEQGWGTPNTNRSVTGQPRSLGGKVFARGVGTHANRISLVPGSIRRRMRSSLPIGDLISLNTTGAVTSEWRASRPRSRSCNGRTA